MKPALIEAKIAEALEHEEANGTAREAVRSYFRMIGRPLPRAAENEAMTFITDYVRHVPALLRDGEAEARRRGLRQFREKVLDPAAWYWELADDVLPDHHGLMGVCDDAYCTLTLLQLMSDHCRDVSGTPLIGIDLTAANTSMRAIIGEPFASQLDNFVAEKFGGVRNDNVLAAMMRALAAAGPMMAQTRDPIWGNASTQEIVNARLGAMGVV